MNGLAVNRVYDSFLRPQSVALNIHPSATLTAFTCDNASRLQTVADATHTAQYDQTGADGTYDYRASAFGVFPLA